MYLDDMLRSGWKRSPNTIIPWVLMASYAYYIKDSPILSDETFDKLCKHLYDSWEKYEHVHKHLIEHESLQAGSLYYLRGSDYPLIAKVVAGEMIERVYGDSRGRTWM